LYEFILKGDAEATHEQNLENMRKRNSFHELKGDSSELSSPSAYARANFGTNLSLICIFIGSSFRGGAEGVFSLSAEILGA